jgi:hypothetical protein
VWKLFSSFCARSAEVVDRVGQVHDLRARLDPAHGAVHDVDLALLGGFDLGGPVHLMDDRLESQLLGDVHHQLTVGAAERAVLQLGHGHVAVHGDIQLARFDRLHLGEGRTAGQADRDRGRRKGIDRLSYSKRHCATSRSVMAPMGFR